MKANFAPLSFILTALLLSSIVNGDSEAFKTLYDIPAADSLRLTGQAMPSMPSYFKNLSSKRIATRGGEDKNNVWVCFPHWRIKDLSQPIALSMKGALLCDGEGYFLAVLGSKTPYEMGPPKHSGDGIGFLALCLTPDGMLSLRDHSGDMKLIGQEVKLTVKEADDFQLFIEIIPLDTEHAQLRARLSGRYEGKFLSPPIPRERFLGYLGVGAHKSAEWQFWDLKIKPGANSPEIIKVLERPVRFARYTLERQEDGTVAPKIEVCLSRPNGKPLIVKVKPFGSPDSKYSREQIWQDVLSPELDGSREFSGQNALRLEGFATFTHLVKGVDCSRENVTIGVFRNGQKLVEFNIKDKWPKPGQGGNIIWMGGLEHGVITRYTWPVVFGKPSTRPDWKQQGNYSTGEPKSKYLFAEGWTPPLTPEGTDWGVSNLLKHKPLACFVGDDVCYPEGRELPRTCQDAEWELFLVWGLCKDLYQLCLNTPVYWRAGDHDRNVDGGYQGRGIYRGSGPPEYPWPPYYNEQVRRLYSACNPHSLDGGDGSYYAEVGELALVGCEDSRFNNSVPPPEPTLDPFYTANGVHVLYQLDHIYRSAGHHFLFSFGDFSLADIWHDHAETMYYYRAEQKLQISWHADCQMMRIVGDRHSSAYIRYLDFSALSPANSPDAFSAFSSILVPECMLGVVRQDAFRAVRGKNSTPPPIVDPAKDKPLPLISFDGAIFLLIRQGHGAEGLPPVKEVNWRNLGYTVTKLSPSDSTITTQFWNIYHDDPTKNTPAYTITEYRPSLGYQTSIKFIPSIKVVSKDDNEAVPYALISFYAPDGKLITTRRADKQGKLYPISCAYDKGEKIKVVITTPDGRCVIENVVVGQEQCQIAVE